MGLLVCLFVGLLVSLLAWLVRSIFSKLVSISEVLHSKTDTDDVDAIFQDDNSTKVYNHDEREGVSFCGTSEAWSS